MRPRPGRAELGRLAAPLGWLVDAAWQRMPWWIAVMAVLYAVSGTTIVRADEVAVVLRWGRLVGATPAVQQHGPGLLFAFPRPMDRVVRVPVRHVAELTVTTLSARPSYGEDSRTLDPVTQGYALTGDQNIVHTDVVARYRIRDVAEWAFYGPAAEDVLRVEVTAALVRTLGEMGVDRVLADGRKDLIASATARAQAGLDASHAGLELSSLELTRLAPPQALAADFDAVQSAYIKAETRRKEARAFAESAIPQAQAGTEAMTQAARGETDAAMAAARGDAAAFLALNREYRGNPAVVRERLYREAIERAIAAAGGVRWIPPPDGGRYHGLRITVPSGRATPAKQESDEEDQP